MPPHPARPAGTPADRPLPSLVVCPSTLVQHWPYEIAKFVGPEALRPLAYHGTPAERAALRRQLAAHDVLVMSYESLRAGAASWGRGPRGPQRLDAPSRTQLGCGTVWLCPQW